MGQEKQDFKKECWFYEKEKNMPLKTEKLIHFSCVYLHMCSLNIRCPKAKKQNKNQQQNKKTQTCKILNFQKEYRKEYL